MSLSSKLSIHKTASQIEQQMPISNGVLEVSREEPIEILHNFEQKIAIEILFLKKLFEFDNFSFLKSIFVFNLFK